MATTKLNELWPSADCHMPPCSEPPPPPPPSCDTEASFESSPSNSTLISDSTSKSQPTPALVSGYLDERGSHRQDLQPSGSEESPQISDAIYGNADKIMVLLGLERERMNAAYRAQLTEMRELMQQQIEAHEMETEMERSRWIKEEKKRIDGEWSVQWDEAMAKVEAQYATLLEEGKKVVDKERRKWAEDFFELKRKVVDLEKAWDVEEISSEEHANWPRQMTKGPDNLKVSQSKSEEAKLEEHLIAKDDAIRRLEAEIVAFKLRIVEVEGKAELNLGEERERQKKAEEEHHCEMEKAATALKKATDAQLVLQERIKEMQEAEFALWEMDPLEARERWRVERGAAVRDKEAVEEKIRMLEQAGNLLITELKEAKKEIKEIIDSSLASQKALTVNHALEKRRAVAEERAKCDAEKDRLINAEKMKFGAEVEVVKLQAEQHIRSLEQELIHALEKELVGEKTAHRASLDGLESPQSTLNSQIISITNAETVLCEAEKEKFESDAKQQISALQQELVNVKAMHQQALDGFEALTSTLASKIAQFVLEKSIIEEECSTLHARIGALEIDAPKRTNALDQEVANTKKAYEETLSALESLQSSLGLFELEKTSWEEERAQLKAKFFVLEENAQRRTETFERELCKTTQAHEETLHALQDFQSNFTILKREKTALEEEHTKLKANFVALEVVAQQQRNTLDGAVETIQAFEAILASKVAAVTEDLTSHFKCEMEKMDVGQKEAKQQACDLEHELADKRSEYHSALNAFDEFKLAMMSRVGVLITEKAQADEETAAQIASLEARSSDSKQRIYVLETELLDAKLENQKALNGFEVLKMAFDSETAAAASEKARFELEKKQIVEAEKAKMESEKEWLMCIERAKYDRQTKALEAEREVVQKMRRRLRVRPSGDGSDSGSEKARTNSKRLRHL